MSRQIIPAPFFTSYFLSFRECHTLEVQFPRIEGVGSPVSEKNSSRKLGEQARKVHGWVGEYGFPRMSILGGWVNRLLVRTVGLEAPRRADDAKLYDRTEVVPHSPPL